MASKLVTTGKAFYVGDGEYIRLDKILPQTIAVGGAAVTAFLGAKNNYENKRLRAFYYVH